MMIVDMASDALIRSKIPAVDLVAYEAAMRPIRPGDSFFACQQAMHNLGVVLAYTQAAMKMIDLERSRLQSSLDDVQDFLKDTQHAQSKNDVG